MTNTALSARSPARGELESRDLESRDLKSSELKSSELESSELRSSESESSDLKKGELEKGQAAKRVVLCESQPLTVEGIRRVLEDVPELKVSGYTTSLAAADEMIRMQLPDVVLVDKAFGMAAIMDWLGQIRADGIRVATVVWGVSISEAEALRMVQAGAQGVIRKTSEPARLVECLERVAAGKTWMEQALLQGLTPSERNPRSSLTPREHQVVELVEQGMKNKEIAQVMGIRPGTVKIHLKHIFEKTGVRGRYGLALSGLKEKGFLQYPTI